MTRTAGVAAFAALALLAPAARLAAADLPAAPPWRSAFGKVLEISGKRECRVELRWERGEPGAYFNVYRSDAPGRGFDLLLTVDEPRFTDTGVACGKTYRYLLRASRDFKLSEPSDERAVTVVEPPSCGLLQQPPLFPLAGLEKWPSPVGELLAAGALIAGSRDLLRVVSAPASPAPADPEDHGLGGGEVRTVFPDGRAGRLDPRRTEVVALAGGGLVRIVLSQEFRNDDTSECEADYRLALPEDVPGGVTDFAFASGGTLVRGAVRPAADAGRILQAAAATRQPAAGFSPAKLNPFVQHLGRVPAQSAVRLTVGLLCETGGLGKEREVVIPAIFGPRAAAHPMNDVLNPRGQRYYSARYLRPGLRSGRDIAVTVIIGEEGAVTAIASPTHRIETERVAGTGAVRVRLLGSDTVPNRDFVLRYRVERR